MAINPTPVALPRVSRPVASVVFEVGARLVVPRAEPGGEVNDALAQDVIDRDHEPAQDRAHGDPEGDHDAERVAAVRPGAGGSGHRKHAHGKGPPTSGVASALTIESASLVVLK